MSIEHSFKNNFNELESQRFDKGFDMIISLLSKEQRDIIVQKVQEQLLEVEVTRTGDGTTGIKGGVYTDLQSNIDNSVLRYLQYSPNKPLSSYHIMLHEMAHLIAKPSEEIMQKEIDLGSDKTTFIGTQMYDFSNNQMYGTTFTECGADLIAGLAMSQDKELLARNPSVNLADDLFDKPTEPVGVWYKPMQSMTRLFALSMDNTFGASYEELLNDGQGLLDRKIELTNGEQVYANDYLYGLTGDGLHLEMQFDKYSSEGTYQEMCMNLDSELKKKIENPNYNMDKGIIKEQMLKMADMLNNKVYILEQQHTITPEQKDEIIDRFNRVFNQSLMEYGIGALIQEDIQKTTVSNMNTYNRLKNGETLEQIQGKVVSREDINTQSTEKLLDGIIQEGQEISITDNEIRNSAREINSIDRETQDRVGETNEVTRDG